MVSIIVPVFNEEAILTKNFEKLEALRKRAELIFVDGGSSDGTIEVASRLGRVLKSKKGRAGQMNCGAREAKGEALLFLHADCFLDDDAIYSAENCLAKGAIGGCFTQCLVDKKIIYRVIEDIGNRRARRDKVFYGDQGIFVKKDIFFSLGGFPDVEMMEDVLFSKKLREKGRVKVLNDLVYVSARRWEKGGFLKTNFLYVFMYVLFCLRLPLSLTKKIYEDVR